MEAELGHWGTGESLLTSPNPGSSSVSSTPGQLLSCGHRESILGKKSIFEAYSQVLMGRESVHWLVRGGSDGPGVSRSREETTVGGAVWSSARFPAASSIRTRKGGRVTVGFFPSKGFLCTEMPGCTGLVLTLVPRGWGELAAHRSVRHQAVLWAGRPHSL